MKKLILGVLFLLVFAFPSRASAQVAPYVIDDFSSEITINQDSSVTVKETIDVTFNQNRHGIYRDIPVVYHTQEKTINSKLRVISVNEEYETSREGDYIRIKIGDPDEYVLGKKTYEIVYRARNIIQRFEDHDELYWNVAGDGWDTSLGSVEASVISDFASISNIQCFEGQVGVTTKCEELSHDAKSANFTAGTNLGMGRDMTIVVALDRNNSINFGATLSDQISDYWGYPVVFVPFLLMFYFWYKKGRDERLVGDNIYYEPDKKQTETTPMFNKREFLPMVYSPIAGLTPSEVGTLIDERVDIHDVVAEIVELGRLGYLKIEKINKKLAKDDYLIKRLKEDSGKLREYQKYLFESIFEYGENGEVKLSELKKKFYTKLEKFKNKLYAHVASEGFFFADPNRVRALWIVSAIAIEAVTFGLAILFFTQNYDFLPIIINSVLAIPAVILAFGMPRKTAKGYAMYRQSEGLKFYLGKGKWREEIKEKQLFLDEILPLAIALGVVNKLARDMQELGVKEPSYMSMGGLAWASSINSFNSAAATTMAPPSSSGGYSGGSGFSGGSGGGFGGGGGGSW